MSGKGYQVLLDCKRRARFLREHGFTIDQIAIVLSLDHQVTPLRLYRYAVGLTAAQTVAAYAHLDPSGNASLREARLYDYETWPDTGRRPSSSALSLLARIYSTHPARLLTPQALTSYPLRDQHLLHREDE